MLWSKELPRHVLSRWLGSGHFKMRTTYFPKIRFETFKTRFWIQMGQQIEPRICATKQYETAPCTLGQIQLSQFCCLECWKKLTSHHDVFVWKIHLSRLNFNNFPWNSDRASSTRIFFWFDSCWVQAQCGKIEGKMKPGGKRSVWAESGWRAAASRLKPLRLPRAWKLCSKTQLWHQCPDIS